MPQVIFISNHKKQYLGTIYLNKDNNLKIETGDSKNKIFLENLLQEITQKDIHITECRYEEKDGRSSHVLYLRKVSPKDSVLYLEGIKEALRAQNLKAYLLEKDKAKLLALAYQSQIPEQIKQAISSHLQDIPEDKTKELIKLFQEEKQGLAKIEKEFEQKLKNLKAKVKIKES